MAISNDESFKEIFVSESEEESENTGSTNAIIIDSADTSGITTPAENSPAKNTVIREEDIRRRIKECIPSSSDESDDNNLSDGQTSEDHGSSSPSEGFLMKESRKTDEPRDEPSLQITDREDNDSVASVQTISNESSSHSDCEMLSVSLAQQEIGESAIDPVIAQKRALLVFKKEKLQKELKDTKLLLISTNVDLLPDKGEKIRKCIAEQQEELENVEAELRGTPLVRLTSNKPSSPWNDARNIGKLSISEKERKADQAALASIDDRLQDLHGSLISRPSEDEKAPDPIGLTVKLMPHQQHALAWLLWREQQRPSGGILADDMGLGKTLTMISLIIASKAKGLDEWNSDHYGKVRHRGGTLVVCPASLLAQWEKEIENKCRRNTLRVKVHHGTKRSMAARELSRNDVVITTYNILARECEHGSTYLIDWERIILDEAHIIRNHKTKICEAVCTISAQKRWALTGTPVHNKMMDLYSIMKFLKCSPFDNIRVWKRWVEKRDSISTQRLSAVTRSLMLRRTKEELQAKGELSSLPEKLIEEVFVTLDKPEELVYKKVLIFSRTLFAQFLSQRGDRDGMYFSRKEHKNIIFTQAENQLLSSHADVKSHEILVLLLRLRQICVHPSLINSMLDQEDMQAGGITDTENLDPSLLSKINNINLHDSIETTEVESETVVDKRLAANLLTTSNPVFNAERISSKMRVVLDKIKEILQTGEKIVIVSQWTGTLQLIASQLDLMKGATYEMFTGKLKIKDRQGVVDSFNNPTGNPKVLLLSLTAGGVGLNLIGANHLLLVDVHWNPQLEVQAQDRIYRYGQSKDVHIYKFICKDTIEENIKALQESKLQLAQNVLTGDKTVGSRLTLTDLKTIFGL